MEPGPRGECADHGSGNGGRLRGEVAYYEESGVLRDMVQNHLTQLLTVAAMEVSWRLPGRRHSQRESSKYWIPLLPRGPDDVVLGQYIGGLIDGTAVSAIERSPRSARTLRSPRSRH